MAQPLGRPSSSNRPVLTTFDWQSLHEYLFEDTDFLMLVVDTG